MFKNKKATMILFPVSIFIMISLIFFYVNYNTKDELQPVNVGDTQQMSILKTYQQAEKALLYIDLSAKYSAQKTIENFQNKKGSFKDLYCEPLDEPSESQEQEDCIPTKKQVYDAFSTDFKLYLDDYLEKYKETELEQGEELIIPLDNYDLLFKKNRLIGIATENLEINKKDINYSVKPSFNIDMGLEFI